MDCEKPLAINPAVPAKAPNNCKDGRVQQGCCNTMPNGSAYVAQSSETQVAERSMV